MAASIPKILGLAQQWLGTPYSWGGGSTSGPTFGVAQGAGTKGFDCSSFVRYLYAQQGIQLPRTTYDQVNQGTPVAKSQLKPGDVVFFDPSPAGPGHEGLYIGGGKYIEAPHTGGQVQVSNLADNPNYVTARRIVPTGAPSLHAVASTAVKTQQTDPTALYFTQVLNKMGVKPTAANVTFLSGWAQREGISQKIDGNNLLGTTLPVNGSHGTNGPGVQDYKTLDDGTTATAQMLSQSNFAGIRQALASGNPERFASSPQLQKEMLSWSGGGYSWPTTGIKVLPKQPVSPQAAVAQAAGQQVAAGVTPQRIVKGQAPLINQPANPNAPVVPTPTAVRAPEQAQSLVSALAAITQPPVQVQQPAPFTPVQAPAIGTTDVPAVHIDQAVAGASANPNVIQAIKLGMLHAADSHAGFTTPSFAKWLANAEGKSFPTDLNEQLRQGSERVGAPQALDQVFFGNGSPTHSGIALGDGLFVHGTNDGQTIQVSGLQNEPYASGLLSVRNVA